MPTTRSGGKSDKSKMVEIDPQIMEAIKQAIREEISPKLKDIDDSVKKILELQHRVEDIEKAVKDTQDRLEDTVNELLPSIADHIAKISEGLAQQTLQMDVRNPARLLMH